MTEAETLHPQEKPILPSKIRAYWPNQVGRLPFRLGRGGIVLKKEERRIDSTQSNGKTYSFLLWRSRDGDLIFELPSLELISKINAATGLTPFLVLNSVGRQLQFGEQAFKTDRTIMIVNQQLNGRPCFILQEISDWSKD